MHYPDLYYPDLFILYVMSFITFVLYAFDKHLACLQKGRIPEAVLLITACLGGAFGALCGMIFFRHKIDNKTFTISIPILVILQLGIDIVYRVFIR